MKGDNMQFLSDEWAEAYTTLLNEDTTIQKKLKKFTALFSYEITDNEEIETLVIEMIKGKCVSFGASTAFDTKDIEFSMSSDTHTWQKILNKEMSIKEALSAHTLHLSGPKLKALSNKAGLEKSVAIMLDMENITI